MECLTSLSLFQEQDSQHKPTTMVHKVMIALVALVSVASGKFESISSSLALMADARTCCRVAHVALTHLNTYCPQPDPTLHSPSNRLLPHVANWIHLIPAFVAQKGAKKSFSVCTADYDYQSGIFAGVDLFTCSGELPVRYPDAFLHLEFATRYVSLYWVLALCGMTCLDIPRPHEQTSTRVGTFTWICGGDALHSDPSQRPDGQNGLATCVNTWVINGCVSVPFLVMCTFLFDFEVTCA